MRIGIIGWPGTGKTTLGMQLAAENGLVFRSTDSALELEWSEASAEVAKWLDEQNWVIEGMALPRALRKWREMNPGKRPPIDRVIRLRKTHKKLNERQIAMGHGHDTIVAELVSWLPRIEQV